MIPRERTACSICWGIMSRYLVAQRRSCTLLSKAFVSKASAETVCLRRITLTLGYVVHTIYTIFILPFRDRVSLGRDLVFTRQERGVREVRGRGCRRPSARKSGAFHTLFMKYIFQQNSSTTCTQPRSDKIDGNVYIWGDVKKLPSRGSSVVYSATSLRSAIYFSLFQALNYDMCKMFSLVRNWWKNILMITASIHELN